MKLRIPILAAATLLAFLSLPAGAHAIVTGSSLVEHPIKAGEATHVLLRFNSAVELGLSRVFLVSRGDKYQQVKIERGPKPGELLVEVPALEPGDYALKYRILAADGHVTEDVLRFHVSG